MPSIKLNGIVTRYADYKDNDRMLTLFTYEQGLVSCAARGCRRAKSPLMGASELFVSGEFVLFSAMISLRWTAPKYPSTIIRSGRI